MSCSAGSEAGLRDRHHRRVFFRAAISRSEQHADHLHLQRSSSHHFHVRTRVLHISLYISLCLLHLVTRIVILRLIVLTIRLGILLISVLIILLIISRRILITIILVFILFLFVLLVFMLCDPAYLSINRSRCRCSDLAELQWCAW